MLRVAIPNKGQLAEPAREILIEAGYRVSMTGRDLVVQDPINDVSSSFYVPATLQPTWALEHWKSA